MSIASGWPRARPPQVLRKSRRPAQRTWTQRADGGRAGAPDREVRAPRCGRRLVARAAGDPGRPATLRERAAGAEQRAADLGDRLRRQDEQAEREITWLREEQALRQLEA